MEIIPNIYDWDATEGTSDLILLLLNLDSEMTLQNLCLKFLSVNKQYYYSFEALPKHLHGELEMSQGIVSLSQCGVSAWCGDRLVIIGDESDDSPYPPDGEWKEGSIYDMDFPSFQPKVSSKDLSKLQELCKGKDYKVANLDKKEYLDPMAYEMNESESSVLDYADNKHGVVTALIVRLIHSSNQNCGDLGPSITSKGSWAGNRITVCTQDQVHGYKDVSNPDDVKLARQEESYVKCCTM